MCLTANLSEKEICMKKNKYLKKAVAGVSIFTMSAAAILPAASVQAAGLALEQNAESKFQLESEAELTAETKDAEKNGTDIADLTKEQIAANDYVLYTVNCGTPDSSVVPNSEYERMGLLQSNVDQAYGVDAEIGTKWGCNAPNEYSEAVKHGDNATDSGDSFIYMSDGVQFDKYKSSLGYSFQVPEADKTIEGIEPNTYEVTVAFEHYWDTRSVNISLEGQTVATDIELGYGKWVSKTFTTTVTDGELNVDIKSPRRTSSKQDPILNFVKVKAVEDTDPEIKTYDSITGTAGETMYDTNGNQIQAHGGQIQQLTVDGETKWYWIGEDKTNDYRPVGGIHVYSSTDLYNWDDEGIVLRTMENPEQFETDPYFNALYGDLSEEDKERIFVDLDKNNTVMERPKMLYNDKTGKYVIWFHADGRYPGSDADYGKAKAGIAVSDSPTGPFELLGSYKLHHAGDNYGYDGESGIGSVRDMNLFKDDNGEAYVIYSSEGNQTTYISRLNEEYTGLAKPQGEAVEGEDFTRNFPGWSREAPAMFKYKDKYYMVNSGCTGWSPNPAQYAVADHPLGPWTGMGDPCTDWGSNTTYDTQSTCVFPVDAENGKYIYMGDRWNAGNLSESRYVWLPVEFQPDNKIALRRYENWTLEELDGKGTFEVISELPEIAASAEEISKNLPEEITISYGTEEKTTPVTWEVGEIEENAIGTFSVKGTLTEMDGRTFTYKVHLVNPDTVYFFDSYSEKSEYFDAVKEKLGDQLLNTAPDQKYTEESRAGYLSVTQEENSENYDMGSHDGGNMWENGWWAASGKSIDYAFDLEAGEYTLAAGFQEWWNTSRDMKITISTEDKVLAENNFRLENWEKDLQVNQTFTLDEAATVKVSVGKTGSSDSVLSWIGIMGKSNENPEPSEKADKTSLNLAVTMAEKMAEEQAENKCYTAESWAAVETALEAAKALQENKEATQEQVDEAFINLITAYNMLENAPQKTGLKAAIEGAENILADTESLAQYTEASIENVRTALEAARLTWEDANATQAAINEATTNLLTAVTNLLTEKEDEATRLDILIEKAEQLLNEKDQYTPSSVDQLTKVLETAKDVAANDQATKEEQKAAYDALAKAMTELVRKANKDELKNALDKANEIIAQSDKYLADSLVGLQEATDAAQEVYDNQDADQETVSNALKELIAQILEVRLMGDVNFDGTVDTQDAAEVLKYNAELEELTEEQLAVADVNTDTKADSSDAGMILQYAVEKMDSFN